MTIKQKIVGKSLASSLLVACVGVLSAMSMLRIGSTLRTVEIANLSVAHSADTLEGAAATIDQGMDAYRAAVHKPEAKQLRAKVDTAFKEIDQATSELNLTLQLKPATGEDRNLLESIEYQTRVAHRDWSK